MQMKRNILYKFYIKKVQLYVNFSLFPSLPSPSLPPLPCRKVLLYPSSWPETRHLLPMSLMPGPSASLVKYTLEFLLSQIDGLYRTS